MTSQQMSLRVAAAVCALLAAAAAQAAESHALNIASRTAKEMAGRFAHEGSVVSFISRLESPGRASVRVEVGALTLEVWADFESEVARTDGHDGVITLRNRQALAALFEQLQPVLGRGPAGLAAHEGLLYRRIAYWSEAPVGTTFGVRQFGPPRHDFGQGRGAVGRDGAAALACQRSDENGITYFNCNRSPQVECHDAGHCFTCASRPAGRNASDCPGECGPGCNGLNVYTWDCLDHDYCCRFHGGCLNPWDSECGDEYREADDDFLWGWPNC